MSAIDLDAYFERIGYDGPRDPTLDALRSVVFAHTTSVPFENLDILWGRGVSLDLETLQNKIIHKRRGGYCFEQNGLALQALREMGFEATGLIGRVRWIAIDDQPTPNTHMLIRVDFEDGPYLCDVGFGGMRLTGVLKLEPDAVQSTPHEKFRLVQDERYFTSQGDLGGRWADVYKFTLEPQAPVDYEMANWYTSTHPTSLFVNTLIVEMPGDGVRRMIVNNSYTERWLGRPPEVTQLNSVGELVDVLQEYFGLTVETEDQRSALAKFIPAP